MTGSVESAAESIEPALEALAIRNDNRLSALRYIVWAVPSIGFLGTVRGIGQALAEADVAVKGNIGPMTDSLAIAFNSTFVALILSVLLTLVLSVIENIQDSRLVRIRSYVEEILIGRIEANEKIDTR